MEENVLLAKPREVKGKKTRFLRRMGLVPGNIYGANTQSVAIQIETPVLRKLVSTAGRNVLVNVKVEGEETPYTTFIREVQKHPVTGDLLHVDFFKVDLTRTIRSEVPIVLTGESPAEKLAMGTIAQVLMNLVVEALPRDLPREIRVDISSLAEVNQGVRVADVILPETVKVLTDSDQLIVRVSALRVEEVEEKPEAAAAEVPAEGEAEAAAGEEAPKEESEQ